VRNNLGQTHATSSTKTTLKKIEIACCDRGSNQGPLDLQPNALPTELSRNSFKNMKYCLIYVMANIMMMRASLKCCDSIYAKLLTVVTSNTDAIIGTNNVLFMY
jgi:hypothetical protein